MKKITLFITIVIIIGCSQTYHNHNLNQFTSQSDTLIIKSLKQKGVGLFKHGATSATFRDTNEWKNLEWFEGYPDYKIIFPDNIEDLKLGFHYIWFSPLRYFDEKSNKTFVQKNTTLADQQIIMIEGKIDDKEVFIVDINNNKDLRDDSIRTFGEWDWNYINNLILCKYTIDLGNEIIEDSSWFQIGSNKNYLLESTAQYLLADIFIDNVKYQFGVIDENSTTFCFFRPILSLFENNGVKKDTILMRDIVKFGEYVRLGKNNYKFHDLYNGCGTIVLTKEERFDTLIGTQTGMLAPLFNCLTIHGDTISSNEMDWKKPLLIANFSGCTKRSYDEFKKLYTRLGNSLNIIGLEPGIKKDIGGILIDVENEYNKNIYKEYRDAYSSYDCYLIDTDKRIADKFEIFDWEDYLHEYMPED